jgi:hypothetical protein
MCERMATILQAYRLASGLRRAGETGKLLIHSPFSPTLLSGGEGCSPCDQGSFSMCVTVVQPLRKIVQHALRHRSASPRDRSARASGSFSISARSLSMCLGTVEHVAEGRQRSRRDAERRGGRWLTMPARRPTMSRGTVNDVAAKVNDVARDR